MPSYNLQVVTSLTPPLQTAGTLTISNGALGQMQAQLQPTGGGNPINVPNPTYIGAGGGTYMNPSPGDTLDLNGFSVTIQGQPWSCQGTGTYRNAGGGQRGGYFTAGASPTGGLGDWDAADGGGIDTKGQ